ncbi:MAG: sigma factor [Polyangiaceae bacterium]
MSRDGAEAGIRSAFERDDVRAAVSRALASYGPEILGYLLAVLRDEQRAEEVYSDFAEDVVRGMPSFRFDSSARTWLYTLARHACARHLTRERKRRTVALSSAPEVLDAAVHTRTPTPPHARTAAREGIERLRKSLRPDDQTLLILRIDRDMQWVDIARVLAGPDAALSEEELRSRSAKLRKRFERLKERLRTMAHEEHILGKDDDA